MTDEELQIKIAKIQGWTSIRKASMEHTMALGESVIPNWSIVGVSPFNQTLEVPKYTSDLNAIHDVVEHVICTGKLSNLYAGWLNRIVEDVDSDLCRYYHANARCRAEAFVLTMEAE
ncbi:MAG: hypothetical protein WC375_13355 [Methanomassiliicoccales archaeon]